MNGSTTLHVRIIDHRHAPTEVRERAHLDPAKAVELMDALNGGSGSGSDEETVSDNGCVSAIPVSTCNRTEIYLEVREDADPDAILRQGLTFIGANTELFFSEHAYGLDGLPAIEHLFRVSSGIESMMLGEPQILEQLKNAYRLARRHYEPGPGLLRAFQGSFRTGKRVRTETTISTGAVSVAFAAVELARKFFDRLSEQKAVLVGAGETGGLAARYFLQHRISHLIVVNRSYDNARELADTLMAEKIAGLGGKGKEGGDLPSADPAPGVTGARVSPRRWEYLPQALAEADVILSTTGALDPVILPEMVEQAVSERKGKPLFLLDIAVPRDVHPDVANINGIFVFGLDDLDGIIEGNLAARRSQVPRAERIIHEELEEFQRWLDDIDLRPTVAEFKAFLEELKDKQVGFVRKKQSDEAAAMVDSSLRQFIKKLLGRSVTTLKNSKSRRERERDLETLRRIFSIEDQNED